MFSCQGEKKIFLKFLLHTGVLCGQTAQVRWGKGASGAVVFPKDLSFRGSGIGSGLGVRGWGDSVNISRLH